MALKLALIDQSIKDFGGHHFEYALRVISAARREGIETVLGVNARAKVQDTKEVRVVPVFRHTFWQNAQRGEKLRRLARMSRSIRTGLRDLWTKLVVRIRYSSIGLTALRAREIAGPHDELFGIVTEGLGPRRSAPEALAGLWGFVLLAKAIRRQVWSLRILWARLMRGRRSGRALRLGGRLIRKLAILVLALLALPVVLVLSPLLLTAMFLRRLASGRGRSFQKDLATFLRKAKLKKGDVIFIPTLGETELLAIIDLCRKSPAARNFRWRLMFRRNVYQGRPSTYARENDQLAIRRLRLILAKAAKILPDVDLRFYTDTDPLTTQYNLANLVPFETAPIPVDPALAAIEKPLETGDRTWFGYFGDARDEKGYYLIAPAIDLLHREKLGESEPHFLIQSNFNVSGGENRSLRGYLELEAMPEKWREIIFGPFPTEAYAALFSRVHAVIIPYDRANYAARSSGVYAEALVAGRPTVVTGGNWMAGLAEPFRQTYLEQIEKVLRRQGKLHSIRTFDSYQGDRTAGVVGNVALDGTSTHLFIQLSDLLILDDEFIEVFVTFQDSKRRRLRERADAIALCRENLRLLIPVPEKATTASIEVRNLSSGVTSSPAAISIVSVQADAPLPLSFGGAICSPSPEGLADALLDVHTNRAAYVEMAATMRSVWMSACDPVQLVRQLVNGAPFAIDWDEAAMMSVERYMRNLEGQEQTLSKRIEVEA